MCMHCRGGGGGGTLHVKGVGMLVISLRGVNFGFWSHLGYSGQNAITFSCEGLVPIPELVQLNFATLY